MHIFFCIIAENIIPIWQNCSYLNLFQLIQNNVSKSLLSQIIHCWNGMDVNFPLLDWKFISLIYILHPQLRQMWINGNKGFINKCLCMLKSKVVIQKYKVVVALVFWHSVHSLHSLQQQAEQLGREDQQRLHRNKKLVLMVDLDQTLIHTTEQHCQRMSNKVIFPHITPLPCNHCVEVCNLNFMFYHKLWF